MQHSTARLKVSEDAGLDEFTARLGPANINPQTFLATDYLNHFNEAIMLLELVPDMPDMLAEAKEWLPKSYQAHFMDSDFAAKDLACEAYDRAPERYRIPFDLTKRALDRRIATSIEVADLTIAQGETGRLGEVMEESCEAIRELICLAGGIINGRDSHPVQAVGAAQSDDDDDHVVMAQQEIDAMFDDGEAVASEDVSPESSPSDITQLSPASDPAPACSVAAPETSEPGAAEPGAEEDDGGPALSQADIDALFD